MQRLFAAAPDENGVFIITGEDAAHLSFSLRMRPGEEITVTDADGTDHLCELVAFSPDYVTAKIKHSAQNRGEPPYRAALYQSLPKGDKAETVVQKAVELGADEIVFTVTERSVARPDAAALEKKLKRYSKIAEAAAKQCGRGRIPSVRALPFKEAVREASEADIPLFCYEKERCSGLRGALASFERAGEKRFRVSVFIGPEGGFSPDEAAFAEESGMKPVGLGARILRTETAGAHVLSCISYEFEQE